MDKEKTIKMAELLKNRGFKLTPVDDGTAAKIQKIAEETGEDAWSIINAAVQLLEKAMGRKVIMQSSDSKLELTINHFKKYKKVSDLKK